MRTSPLSKVVFVVVLLVHLGALYSPRAAGESLFPGVDKVTHATLFAALLVAAWWLGARLVWLAPLLAVHAVESEVVQALLLPHRDGSVGDAAADIVGVLLGVAVCRLVAARAGRAHAA